MMLNVKKYVRKILADSSDITALVPATKILSAYPDEVVNFPCIIYEEQGQNDVEFSDNLPYGTRARVRIHIFTKSLDGYATTTTIGKLIHSLFRIDYWTCTLNTEVQDTDESVKHRIMDFTRSFYGWEN
jgi:hypothetical protein